MNKCARWLMEQGCSIGVLDGAEFVIVPCGSKLPGLPAFDSIITEVTGARYRWGYEDEFCLCSNCCDAVIRTSPDSYSWQPDFWLGDGFIFCRLCAREMAEDYITYMSHHRDRPRVVNPDIASPEEHGFTLVVKGAQYGLHEGQADDPKAVARWAAKNGLEVIFTISQGQFDVEWNAWMRKGGQKLTDVEAVKDALLQDGYLRDEFRQHPSPAAELKKLMGMK